MKSISKAMGLILLVIGILTFLLGLLTEDFAFMFHGIMFIWVSNVLDAVSQYRKRYIQLVFLLTYFMFYLGRIAIHYYTEGTYSLENYTHSIVMTVFCIHFISLISIYFLYHFLSKARFGKNGQSRLDNRMIAFGKRINIQNLARATKLVFWVTFPFAVIIILERVLFVRATGYASYYTDYASHLPGFVSRLGDINEIAFFMYIVTNPPKKKCRAILWAFLSIGILSLGYGQRNPMGVRFAFVFLIYYPLRDQFRNENEERWITHKYKRMVLLGGFLIVLLFGFWGYFRAGNQYGGGSLFSSFVEFFDTQGNSSFIIAESIKQQDNFPTGRIYTLSPIISFLTNNVIYRLFGGTPYPTGFTANAALNGIHFSTTLSYLYSSFHFLQGIGVGSAYLAEVFFDFQYLGVILISLLYMYIIMYVQKKYGMSWIGSLIGLLSVYKIIYAPRDLALNFVHSFFSFTFILTVIVVYLLYSHFQRNRGKQR